MNMNIYAENRLGERVHVRGHFPTSRVASLLALFSDCINEFDLERPIVLYNSGFALWQQGRLGVSQQRRTRGAQRLSPKSLL